MCSSDLKDVSLAAAKEAAPEFARALLVSELGEDWKARAEAIGAAGMNVGRRRLSPGAALAIKRAGYVLSVWTVNDPEEAKGLLAIGADSIISDAPDVILAALRPR